MDFSFSNARVNLVDLLARRASMRAWFTEALSGIQSIPSPVMGLFWILFHNKKTSVKTRGMMNADIQFSVRSVRSCKSENGRLENPVFFGSPTITSSFLSQ